MTLASRLHAQSVAAQLTRIETEKRYKKENIEKKAGMKSEEEEIWSIFFLVDKTTRMRTSQQERSQDIRISIFEEIEK